MTEIRRMNMRPAEDGTKMVDEKGVVPAQAVARRALCLAALCYRAHIDAVASGGTASFGTVSDEHRRKLETAADGISAWLRREQLWAALSGSERAVLGARVGGVDMRELIDATWRTEALAVLLWALGLAESVPPYDTKSDLGVALESIPFLKDARTVVVDAKLRSPAELEKARDVAEIWHWRARTDQIRREPDHRWCPGEKTLDSIARQVAAKGQDRGLFAAIDGDFPVLGKSYRDATGEEWGLLRSIASERHYALNWLCGRGEDWDEVTTDT